MRILIIGGDGMLGHQLLQVLQKNHEVRVTLRQDLKAYASFNYFNKQNSYSNVDVRNTDDVMNVLVDYKPQAVINAAGIVKQRKDAKDAIPSLEINALFPHRLAVMCEAINARMVHMSTDCVFTGKKGSYTEEDLSDAEDIYGKTKYLGEVSKSSHCVTIRSSIIGLELTRKTSLIEWFLMQKGTIKGFRKAMYSGLTTLEMSRLIENILVDHPQFSGMWHVSSDTISKYDLLQLFADKLGRSDIIIEPDNNFFCDRSLLSDPFKKAISYRPPSWESMLGELAEQVQQR